MVRVDAVREVERGRAGRQVLDVTLRGEDEHLVLEDVELDPLDELGRVRLADVVQRVEGRAASAATATGLMSKHLAQLKALLDEALS